MTQLSPKKWLHHQLQREASWMKSSCCLEKAKNSGHCTFSSEITNYTSLRSPMYRLLWRTSAPYWYWRGLCCFFFFPPQAKSLSFMPTGVKRVCLDASHVPYWHLWLLRPVNKYFSHIGKILTGLNKRCEIWIPKELKECFTWFSSGSQ